MPLQTDWQRKGLYLILSINLFLSLQFNFNR